MKLRLIPVVLATLLLLPISASAARPDFPDVAPEYWAYDEITQAAEYGLVLGHQDGNFAPRDTLNRASFVTILGRMFGWTPLSPAAASFADVGTGHWAFSAVETAKANGVLEAGEKFYPDAYISRETMSVMLVKALGYDTLAQDIASKGIPFPDVTKNVGYIALARAIGMTNGILNEATNVLEFQPQAFATREQAAAMLVRVYQRYISKVDWLHGFYAFSSFAQINMTAQMDGVSVGWARMSWSPEKGPWLNSTKEDNNDWVKPQDVTPATSYFQGNQTPYNLNIYADTKSVTLADGTATSAVAEITKTTESRAKAIGEILAVANDYAGITIDFEGMKKDNEVKVNFVSFMRELKAALPQGKTLYVCVPPDEWYKGFDYKALGEICDKVILMAHDYQWSSAKDYVGYARTDSPVTPFPKIFEALADITDPVIGVQDRSKIALAISFGTAGLKIDDNGLVVDGTVYHPAQATIAGRLRQQGTAISYDEHFRNPFAIYTTEDGGRYKLWYEDARSVGDKIALARMFGITGVSLWRIGNIPNTADAGLFYDAWSAVLAQR